MSLFHTHFLLPLAEPERHAGLARRMREIRRFERLPAAAQRDEQQQRLRRILQHAYDTVPLQRKRFDDAGFDPSQARIDRPLPLPVLTRDDLRHAGNTLLSSTFTHADLRQAGSSGTTSTPIQFFRNIEALRDKTALQIQLNSWSGYKPGDSVLMLWGAHRDLAMQPSWRWRFYEQMLMRSIPAPSGVLNNDVLDRFRERYEKHRPKVLYAYSTVLAAFAAHMQKRPFTHRPSVMVATAEVMSDENRRLIESVFGTPVTMHYGSREAGMIASECAHHDGLHFHPWGCHVEFESIGDTPDGPAYRLLITDLLNYGQPFLRYDSGDCVTLQHKECSCGRWFPKAEKILGRVCEGIVLADGGIIPGITLGTQLAQLGYSFRSIAQVQFVQKNLEHLHLRYSVKEDSSHKQRELDSIRTAIDALMNHPAQWTLEQVAEIPRERSGKIRLCVSEIPTPESTFSRSLLTSEHV
jgi:phenylacetate-CoA ligase